MYLKMMGAEDAPDSEVRKTYRIIQQVVDVGFERKPDGHVYVNYAIESGELFTLEVLGHVYVLNDQGKTISSFGPGQIAV